MNAVELKFENGQGTGLWYCSRCLQVQNDTNLAESVIGKFFSEFKVWRQDGNTRWNKERANQCCTSEELRPQCTGCRRHLQSCICGRAKKNLCTGCGKKLYFREGRLIEFGAATCEFCHVCATTLQAKLADAGKYTEYPGLESSDFVLK